MFSRRYRSVLTLVSGIALTLAVAAQVPLSSPASSAPVATFSLTSRLVVLDIVVTDKQGHIVPGLAKDDFSIFENGKPQSIRSFEDIETHRFPSGLKIQSTADLAKAPETPVTILVLDELNTRFEDMNFAREAAETFLNRQPAVLQQPTALLVVSNTSFQVLQDYTLDRQALLAALKNHFPEYPWKLMHSGKGGPGTAERLAMSLGSLEQIAQSSAGHPGRKNLVWIGRGFPAVNTQESTDRESAVLQQALRRVIAIMRDSRITLSSIDPTIASAGTVLVETPDDLDIAENSNGSDPFAGEMNFELLAPATGGRIYASRNDVDAAIDTTVRDGGNYYTLSYSPASASDAAQAYRRIQVKMNRAGFTATTRNGYYLDAVPASATAASSGLDVMRKKIAFDLGSAANSNLAYTGLAVTAPSPAKSLDSLTVHIDTKDLSLRALNDGASQAEVTILVACFDDRKMIAHEIRELTAHIDASAGTAEFRVPAAIPSAASRVRIVARDAANGKMGTTDINWSAVRAK